MRKNQCDYCAGKLGLIVHRLGFRRFCSDQKGKRCKEKYFAAEARRMEAEKRRGFAFLKGHA